MANASFTRDEVILALDALYFSEEKTLSPDSKTIIELCELLQSLPIHPTGKRKPDFRNQTGVNRQLSLFRTSCKTGRRDPNVGELFFTVAQEYENNIDELHLIAKAIRKNRNSFETMFGSITENMGFPEGVLLGHLHTVIEKRDGRRIPLGERCSVCQIEPQLLYRPCGSLLEQHLVVSPLVMDCSKKYKSTDFITVCPSCHAALHRFRPWLNEKNCGDVLR